MFKKEKNGKTNIKSSKKEAKILVFLLVLAIIFTLLIFSKIRIKIENFKFTSLSSRHTNKDFNINIKICILRKIPIISIGITKQKIQKLKLNEKMKNADLKVIEDKKFDKKMLELIKKSNISIKKFDLKIELGTKSPSLTALLVPIVSTIIAIILQKNMQNTKNYYPKFIIEPKYINQNLINIAFDGIFEMKLIHIINMIYILNKKEKEGVKKYERTSNRRSYDYSYE